MNKLIYILFLSFYVLTLQAEEKSPFNACQNVVLIKEEDYLKDKAEWEKKFTNCKDINFQIVPSVGFAALSINTKTSFTKSLATSVSTIDLLTKVGNRTIDNLNKNIAALKLTKRCLENEKVKEEELAVLGKGMTCEFLATGIKAKMKENLPKAREELALLRNLDMSSTEKALQTLNSQELINGTLSKSGGLIMSGVPYAKNLPPLSKDENDKAKANFDLELLAIRAEWNKKAEAEVEQILEKRGYKPTEPRYQKAKVAQLEKIQSEYPAWGTYKISQFQKRHESEYMKLMAKSPYLMHVGSENPTSKEIADAIPKLIESAKNELERSEKILKEATLDYEAYKKNYRAGSHQGAVKDLLYFLGNVPMVEMQLQEDKLACSTASGLVDFISGEKSRNNLLMIGGLFGGIYFAATKVPALVGAVTGASISATTAGAVFGAGVGTYFQYEAVQEKKLAQEKFESGVGSFQKYSEAKNALELQTVLYPFDLVGGAVLAGKGVKSAMRLKEVAAMRRVGVPEDAISQLLLKVDSKVPEVALGAQKEIARYGWSDLLKTKIKNDELELLTHLISSGSIPSSAKRVKVMETLQVLNKLDEAEKKAIDAMNGFSPKGAYGLLQVHRDIQGKPGTQSERFQARLESLGVDKNTAQKMCQCARVCKILKAGVEDFSNFNRMCAL